MKIVVVLMFMLGIAFGQWPCPSVEDILPCICIYNEVGSESHLILDCSAVKSEQELSNACNALIPFQNFEMFILRNSDISELKSTTFGPLSFVKVDISLTKIQSIELGTFNGSFDQMETLIFTNNLITTFPSDFSPFNKLFFIDLSGNDLVEMDIKSSQLEEIELSNNNISYISLANLQNIKRMILNFNHMESVPRIPANTKLEYLSIENNNILYIGDVAFGNPDINIESLLLNSNGLQSITPSSFDGIIFNANSYLDLSSNNIEYLYENQWGYLLGNIIPTDAIGIVDLTDNPILCGCEILWIISNSTILNKIDASTTCQSGNLLIDIDLDVLESFC